MLFSSITFLYYFLPAALLFYFAVPGKWKSAVLLSASLFFYFWGEPKYCVLMLVSVFVGWLGGIGIGKYREKEKLCKWIAGSSIGLVLAFLAVFKYTDFFIQSLNLLLGQNGLSGVTGISGADIPLLQIVLPVGISFYTFQIISYLADVYRGDMQEEQNFIDFAAYVTMFPQLIAGPIVRYSSIRGQMKEKKEGSAWDGLSAGFSRFSCGLAKKVLIADVLGELVLKLDGMDGKTTVVYWCIAVIYMLQIYYDFSGYSDMAIGLGKVLGFDFPENFNYPYMSKSVTEFWRRWHITLGSWFRDYVYIPMGGSRVSVLRFMLNIFVVWFLSGLWHGAGWNFVLWGLYFGVFLAVERLLMKSRHRWKQGECPGHGPFLKFCHAAGHIYTLIVIAVSFVIFRQEDLSIVGEYLRAMFFGTENHALSVGAAYEIKSYTLLLIAAAAGAAPGMRYLLKKMEQNRKLFKLKKLLEPAAAVLLLLLATSFLLGSSVHPFLYFRF